jgi:hypothetical protein
MLGLDASAGACAALAAGNMCEDPVVKVACMGTCAGGVRRLTAETEAHLASARHVYGTHFRQTLSEIEAKLVAAGGRRLDGHEVTLYGSYDPTAPLASGLCPDPVKSAAAPPNYGVLDATPWWDWWSWLNTKNPLTITPDCPPQPTYFTDSKKYCDTNNMVIMGLGDASIANDLCWKKCATPAADGTLPEFCDGFDPAFNAYSNALCVPRSTCEAYCDQLGGMCMGFEMHREVPRCYLITDVCMEPVTGPSTVYDQVTKGEGPFRYYTYYEQSCALGAETAPVIAPILSGSTREACELACNDELDCGGFDYTPATGACAFRSVIGSSVCGKQMTFDSTTAMPDLTATAGTHYVEKMANGVSVLPTERWSPACKAVMGSSSPGYLPGTALGAYIRTVAADCGSPLQDVVCYMSPTSSHRLVWGNQAKFSGLMYLDSATGVGRQCSGWVLEEMGESGAYEPIYATYTAEGLDCLAEPSQYALTGYDLGMYTWKPAMDYSVSMNFICKSYPMCGTLQTCVLAKNRFNSEVAIQLTKGSVVAAADGFISDTPSYETLLDPVTFRPKTLISVETAILFAAKVKEQYGTELYRNVPGHLRIKIADLGAGVSSAVIKMFSASVTPAYAIPAGYDPWYTDVVRVEKFGPDGTVDAGGPTLIDFYAPTVITTDLMVIAFDKTGVEMAKLPAAAVPGSPGYWRVAVTVSGDYLGTTEMKCPSVPPTITNAEGGLVCPILDAGAECALICMPGYEPSSAMTCRFGAWSTVTCDPIPGYVAEKQFFRLSHRSRLDYGWRIRKITAFSDAGCTNQISTNQLSIVGPSDSYLNSYPPEKTVSGLLKSILTSNLNAETQCLGSSSACHDFWSSGLNVNPYPVDETHGGAAFVEFTVESTQSVQCVKVVSRSITGT